MLHLPPALIRIALPLLCLAVAPASHAGPPEIETLVRKLNEHATVKGSDDSKSWRLLFDAYLKLTPPPLPVGEAFNLSTIHPGMSNWGTVSDWAESNGPMTEAILKSAERTMIGMPYGKEAVPPEYRQAGLMVDFAGGTLRDIRFPYLPAVDTIAAFATAETYRLLESGDVEKGLDVALASLRVLRQFCDRDFLEEKWNFIGLLAGSLQNLRDVFYLYMDKITVERLFNLAWWDLPFLRPDRSRLLMPEADRTVAEALLREVFDAGTGMPDGEHFARVFAAIQSEDEPLTRFGAARRWRMISEVHGSLDASEERLKLVYDDWWRRWRIQEYDAILGVPSHFERSNRIRYAAVLYSLRDIQGLFALRNRLIVEVNGTAVAAGVCAYKREFGVFPNQNTKILQFVRRLSDTDPYDLQFGRFKFFLIEAREAVDSDAGRFWVESGQVLLYSIGQDHEDRRPDPMRHSDDGFAGDILIWPPVKAIQRKAGLLP